MCVNWEMREFEAIVDRALDWRLLGWFSKVQCIRNDAGQKVMVHYDSHRSVTIHSNNSDDDETWEKMCRLGLYISNLYRLEIQEIDLRKKKTMNINEFMIYLNEHYYLSENANTLVRNILTYTVKQKVSKEKKFHMLLELLDDIGLKKSDLKKIQL